MRNRFLAAAALAAALGLIGPGPGTPSAPKTAGPKTAGVPSVPAPRPAAPSLAPRAELVRLPMSFIPNGGQMDRRVAFYAQGRDRAVYFGADGLTYSLAGGPDGSRWTVKLDFAGREPGSRPEVAAASGTVVSYFGRGTGAGAAGLRAASRIVYRGLWPGIDLAFSGGRDALKSEILVGRGADPSRIRFAVRGATGIRTAADGSLVVSTPAGEIVDGRLAAWQVRDGTRIPVEMAYEILDAGDPGAGRPALCGFRVGAYDRGRPLVLDPVDFVYCGFLGGPGYDYINAIAADARNRLTIAGTTFSATGFPAVAGPDPTFNGGTDAFVARLNPEGTALEYCGFIGGAGNDYGTGVAVDAEGNAYVTGYTASGEATFPVTGGPDLTHNGLLDAFVAKVGPSGAALLYCGYIGGAADDVAGAIALDGLGRAHVAGSTSSGPASFPVRGGPSLEHGGLRDAFAAVVAADGSSLERCGYIGGAGDDAAAGIAADAAGNAYVVGSTTSTDAGSGAFPLVMGPSLTYKGGVEAFVAKVKAEDGSLAYCGYIGGFGQDYATAVAVDKAGNAFLTGYTSSDSQSFPISNGPSTSHSGGFYDAFAAKVRPDGELLMYCGYIGGADYDVGTAIAVDGRGYARVVGYTSSKADALPVKEGPVLTLSGSFDAFVAKIDASGRYLGYCGYIGGVAADQGTAVALGAEASGIAFVAGTTYSTAATFPTLAGPDLNAHGSRDGFAARLYETSISITSPRGGDSWHVGFPVSITWDSDGAVGNVHIELSTDSAETWTEIATSTENDGEYTLIVPETTSVTCFLRISEAEDAIPSMTTVSAFAITNEPVIFVTAPNGGEVWTVGSTQTITWKTGGDVGDLLIQYSSDGGETWTNIVDSTENDGAYEWIVPDAASETALVRIMEATDGDPSDDSDTYFTIKAASSPASVVGGRLSQSRPPGSPIRRRAGSRG